VKGKWLGSRKWTFTACRVDEFPFDWYYYICVEPRSISQPRAAMRAMSANHPHIFGLAVVSDHFTKSRDAQAVAGQRCAGIYAAETTTTLQRSLLFNKRCAHDVVANYIIFVMGAPFEVQSPSFYVLWPGLIHRIPWKLHSVGCLALANRLYLLHSRHMDLSELFGEYFR